MKEEVNERATPTESINIMAEFKASTEFVYHQFGYQEEEHEKVEHCYFDL
jgi:hypothetical protein